MIELQIELEFLESILGTWSANPDIVREFISSKGTNADAEVEAIPDVDEAMQKSTTVFARNDAGEPILYDYQIKGFFKDACGCLSRIPDSKSKQLRAYKKEIDGLVFVTPRHIPLILPAGKPLTYCQRPLRAQTAQGERIALARSEEAAAGARCAFAVTLLKNSLEGVLSEWLSYGKLRGLGQWRNSGHGRFDAKIVKAAAK